MPTFQSSSNYTHGTTESLGVLLVNLGTPDAPTPSAVRRYLGQFLWDPRVVELPRVLWWLILHGIILRFRPAKSAEAYQKIWTAEGSPLLLHSQAIAEGVRTRLPGNFEGDVSVELGMSYGNPSIPDALERLNAANVTRVVVLPLYPQYSGTTTASVFDAVTRALSKRRWVPELRFVNQYHDYPEFIAAHAANIKDYWQKNGRGDKLLFSFHGVPMETLLQGDPYHCQCHKTARLITEALDLQDDEWLLSFQSRVGRSQWLKPYTDETVTGLGRSGLQRLDVVCPGFSADCLETLEEIAMQNGEFFTAAGGGELRYIPALNERDDHVTFLTNLLVEQAGTWHPRQSSAERASAMGARQ
jgi:ferrochelatase